ncbi:MAG: molybdopterin molybdotransferase MoeA [Micrococcales bacterium]|nr:molybdopterin molybdotransferase MoeA [Micrococcales bacterium]MCL2666959.1 molybdopterin molybdotransferase MoeA [Micrococcales bacterium]
MKSVQEHLAAVLELVGPVEPLDVVLHDAAGCVLAADVVATSDVPGVAVARCDGYALGVGDQAADGSGEGASTRRGRHATTSGWRLPVVADVRPGPDLSPRLVTGQCVRIASGAPLPPGADAVVPLEDTDRGVAEVTVPRDISAGLNVRPVGHDVRAGTVVLAAGTRLGARQLGLAAAVGRSRLTVHPSPRVVLVAVGDELVEPGAAVAPGQVHESNRYALEAAVHDAGCTPIQAPVVADDHAALRETLEDQLVRADVVVVTGGLSEMAHDTVKDVLPLLGDVRVDRVAISPGGRFGLGVLHGTGRDVPVLALPGDPVAATVVFEVLVRPALCTMAGQAQIYRRSVPATVSRGWVSPDKLRQFVPATVVGDAETGYAATVLADPDHPALADVVRADVFVVVPENDQTVYEGRTLPCLVLG